MPTVSVYPAGGTSYMSPRFVSTHERAKRDVITGWSPSATRRLTKWLMSVDGPALTGHGYAVTLTMRDTPPDRAALDRVFRALMERYRHMGVVRLQWVMELQRRGTPHFHMAVYMPEPLPHGGMELLMHWLAVAEPYGASAGSQDVKALGDSQGWFQYMCKHAGRSVAHYQRQGMPPGWDKTGRLWGKRGDWPTVEPMDFALSDEAWFRFRRLLRSWRIDQARRISDPKLRARRISEARRMLASSDRKRATVRGTREWAPQHVQLAWLGLLADQGHEVVQVFRDAEEPSDSLTVRRLQRAFHEGLSYVP